MVVAPTMVFARLTVALSRTSEWSGRGQIGAKALLASGWCAGGPGAARTSTRAS
jgi:hypothetical protein